MYWGYATIIIMLKTLSICYKNTLMLKQYKYVLGLCHNYNHAKNPVNML